MLHKIKEAMNSTHRIYRRERNRIRARLIGTKYKNLSRPIITKKSEAIKLRDYSYGDSSLFLERKKGVFDNIAYKQKEVLG